MIITSMTTTVSTPATCASSSASSACASTTMSSSPATYQNGQDNDFYFEFVQVDGQWYLLFVVE